MKILVESGVDASLHIGGEQSKGIRQSGYKRYILGMINDFKLKAHVKWLGALDAKNIVSHLQASDVVLIPSYIESYSVTLYEAIAVGVPIVCSYAGAMPEASKLTSSIHYFQPGDYRVAASLLSDKILCKQQLNRESITLVTSEAAVKRQLTIYNDICSI